MGREGAAERFPILQAVADFSGPSAFRPCQVASTGMWRISSSSILGMAISSLESCTCWAIPRSNVPGFNRFPLQVDGGASDATSTTMIQQLRSIFATVGLPEVLVSDNGPNFNSAEFESFLIRNDIRHKTSPPYHPATNGLAERAVQTVKKGLKMTHGSMHDWLSRFLFIYRNMPQSTTGVFHAQLHAPGLKTQASPAHPQAWPPQASGEGARRPDWRSQQAHLSSLFLTWWCGLCRQLWTIFNGSVLANRIHCTAYQVKLTDRRIIRCHVDHLYIRHDVEAPLPDFEQATEDDLSREDRPASAPPPSAPSSPRKEPPEDLVPSAVERRYPTPLKTKDHLTIMNFLFLFKAISKQLKREEV